MKGVVQYVPEPASALKFDAKGGATRDNFFHGSIHKSYATERSEKNHEVATTQQLGSEILYLPK